MSQPDALASLCDRLRVFAAERSWQRFHTPKNLAMAVAGEAGELAAVLQWAEADEDIAPYIAHLEEEVGDVLIYLIRLCDVAGIDPIAAASQKITRNAERFPVVRDRGEGD